MSSRGHLLVIFLLAVCAIVTVRSDADNLMSCVFCNLITETLTQDFVPPHAIKNMYRKCAKMGLMEPVCDAFVEENAKRMYLQYKSGLSTTAICAKICVTN